MVADIRFNIKNPAGDYVQHERNLEVFRQTSQAKAKREKELLAEEKMKAASQEGAPEVPDVSPMSSVNWIWLMKGSSTKPYYHHTPRITKSTYRKSIRFLSEGNTELYSQTEYRHTKWSGHVSNRKWKWSIKWKSK
jgi:hypothetical protein